jgi:hypothetical protein
MQNLIISRLEEMDQYYIELSAGMVYKDIELWHFFCVFSVLSVLIIFQT